MFRFHTTNPIKYPRAFAQQNTLMCGAVRCFAQNNFKCQNLSICQKVVSVFVTVDVLHVAS